MSANSSQAFLCETTDGRSPRVGDPLSQTAYGTTNRLVVSGSPCRVGEVNCVVVTPDATAAARIGSIRLVCDDSTTEHFVQFAATFAAVAGAAINQDPTNLGGTDTFAPWQSNSSPSGLDVYATHLGRRVEGEYFVSRITSSINNESYANTFGTFAIVLAYAGEDRVVAGYHDGFGVVMYATAQMPEDSSYIDAKPLRTPVFRVEQTSSALRPIGTTTTQAMGIASATANRVGALDRKSSATATGPVSYQNRQSNACDNNSFTFLQRKVDRSFLQDSSLWKYSTTIALSIPEKQQVNSNAVIEALPNAGTVVAGAWQKPYDTIFGTVNGSYGGWPINSNQIVFGSNLQFVSIYGGNASTADWLSGVNLSLTHSLNDGTKTFPSEWHAFAEWSRTPFSSPAPSLSESRNVSYIFRTQGATAASLIPTQSMAEETVNALNSFSWSSYYVIGSQITREPQKVQASFYIVQSNSSSVTVSARLRFTWLTTAVFSRAYYSLNSASATLLPPEQSFLGGPDYRVDATFGYGNPSVACTRQYAGVANVTITEIVPIAKWRQFAQGQQIEITDGATGRTCNIQLKSA